MCDPYKEGMGCMDGLRCGEPDMGKVMRDMQENMGDMMSNMDMNDMEMPAPPMPPMPNRADMLFQEVPAMEMPAMEMPANMPYTCVQEWNCGDMFMCGAAKLATASLAALAITTVM